MISKRFIQRGTRKLLLRFFFFFFQQREQVTKSLEVFGRSTRLYIVVPFLCPFLCLTFSVVAFYLWCGTLFSRCRISVYQSIVMRCIVATCYNSRVATQPHYISPLLSIAQYLNLTQYKCQCIVYCVYSDDSSANYSALLREGSGHIFQHSHLH